MMTSLDLENTDLILPNSDLEGFLYGPTYPPNVVFLGFTGAEIAGAHNIPPPLQGA